VCRMPIVRHIRFHGRGGEGVKLASRIVSRAAFLAGRVVQDSPLYGAERRGAPVVAFTRVSDQPILERGYIDIPDAVVVIDASLLAHPGAEVLHGLEAHSLVLVNSTHTADELGAQHRIAGRVVALDVSSIALELLGQHVLSAPIAGFTVKATDLAAWDVLAQAVRVELGEIGLPAALVERNLAATRRAFDAAPAPGLRERQAGDVPLRSLADLERPSDQRERTIEQTPAAGPDLERSSGQRERTIEEPPAAGPAGPDLERSSDQRERTIEETLAAGPPAAGPPTAGPAGPFTLPHLPARFAAPSIDVAATSALRTTEGWRVFRPEIELAHCTRCFICFVLCPEGAIELDEQHYPVVDYAHCKGCLVCVTECPPKAITEVREAAA
jgi:2-oxoacid:acceptor oxidoreductase gamma subunit (pyruvate/2-ketoisovalerate family)/2-oxoacid:acceptor oxidoreductase delta subunit (pyruvate/2-ketoisovalerate family)